MTWFAALGLLAATAAAAQPNPAAPPEAPALVPGQAEAQAALVAYARTEPYRKLMAQALARVPASVVPRCPKLVTADAGLTVTSPLQITSRGVSAGSWRQSLTARGCGNDTVVNFFFYGTPDGRVITVVGAPGTTRADLMQQRDARTYTVVAHETVARGCSETETVNTRFEGFGSKPPGAPDPGPQAAFRPWWETWTVRGCGKQYQVPLNFTPNRMGMQIAQPGGVAER